MNEQTSSSNAKQVIRNPPLKNQPFSPKSVYGYDAHYMRFE